MTIKTLSAIAVRIIGWLVVLEGIKSCLSLVFSSVLRMTIMSGMDSSRPMSAMLYVPLVTGVVIGFVELGVGFAIIQNCEFFGRILSKGLDERL